MSLAAEAIVAPSDTGNSLVYPLNQIRVEPDRLLDDLRDMEENYWIHQNRYRADIDYWDGIALYSVNGDTQDLRVADHLPVYQTPAGEKCAYICKELLPQFRAPWLRVVLYRLKAGAKIGRHRDTGENRLTSGFVRIHVPIVTNDKVLMYVADRPYHFGLGSAWYFDATAFHSVENNGSADRVHLVVDLRASRELNAILKPLTSADRLRLTRIAFRHAFVGLPKSFIKFMRTPEGRARIRARAKIVFGRNRASTLRGTAASGSNSPKK